MTLASARAMRASLDARIVSQAGKSGLTPGRLRRRLVFHRVLRRLAAAPDADQWILKGGFLLETRLPTGARSTRDLDLVSAENDPDVVRALLDGALSADPDGDFFTFVTTRRKPLRADGIARTGSRFSVTAMLADRTFDDVCIDIAARAAETVDGTSPLEIPCPLIGPPLAAARVTAVDIAQHAAEKFHAMSRVYAGQRTSTRVKDLVDVVLMVEAGLLPDPALMQRLLTVFRARDEAPPPADLAEPPRAWATEYRTLTAELRPAAADVEAGFAVARQLYREALADHAASGTGKGTA